MNEYDVFMIRTMFTASFILMLIGAAFIIASGVSTFRSGK